MVEVVENDELKKNLYVLFDFLMVEVVEDDGLKLVCLV